MASIERMAYPRFKRFMSARELHVFYTPRLEEMVWAREVAGSDEHLLALVTQLKTFNRLGWFPTLGEVPAEVIGHIRRDLRLPESTRAVYASSRTGERHRNMIRARSEVVYDPVGARKLAADAIEEAADRKNDPADLINIALERLVEGSYELPAFRTLNDMATTIRARVNEDVFATVLARIGELGIAQLERLLEVGAGGKSEFNQLKRSARRPSWSNFRAQLEHLRWVDGLGDARVWWQGVPPSKIADFAGEAASADAAVMGHYGPAKRVALVAALVFSAQAKARDDTAEMFCRRVGTLTKRSRDELEELKQRHREITERLVDNYRSVLERIDPDGPAAIAERAALHAARDAVAAAGGFAAQYSDIDTVTAHHGDNHVPLLARHFRNDRAAMLAMASALGLRATSADHSVLDLLAHVREHAGLTRDYIPDHIVVTDEVGNPLLDDHGSPRTRVFDTGFASENWNKAIRDRRHPGMFVRRHLEACVLTYLAEELRTGDVAVEGAQSYANWADQLISVQRCAQLLPAFCAEVGLPETARSFRSRAAGHIRQRPPVRLGTLHGYAPDESHPRHAQHRRGLRGVRPVDHGAVQHDLAAPQHSAGRQRVGAAVRRRRGLLDGWAAPGRDRRRDRRHSGRQRHDARADPGDVTEINTTNPGRVQLWVRGMPVELEGGLDTIGIDAEHAGLLLHMGR